MNGLVFQPLDLVFQRELAALQLGERERIDAGDLAWQLNSNWQYDADFVTELEIRFIPEGGATRVELEHRDLEKFGDKASEVHAALDSAGGWTGTMDAFAAEMAREK